MLRAIWFHLNKLKNVKNIHGGVLLVVKLQAKLYKASQIQGDYSLSLSNSVVILEIQWVSCELFNPS